MLLGVMCCSVVSVVAEADVLSFLSRKTSYLQEMQSFSFESCFQEACQHAFFFFFNYSSELFPTPPIRLSKLAAQLFVLFDSQYRFS